MDPVELTTLVGAAVALASSVGFPLYASRHKEKAEKQTAANANEGTILGAQQNFVMTLQKENDKLRKEIDELRNEVEKLRDELAAERRARETSEARITAETQARFQVATARSALRASGAEQVTAVLDAADAAGEAQIQAAGDAAVAQSRSEQDRDDQ